MSEKLKSGPSDQLPYSPAEVRRVYAFGYSVFPDGRVYGRDPLQEANAGLEVDPSEIDAALQMIEDDRRAEEDPWR